MNGERLFSCMMIDLGQPLNHKVLTMMANATNLKSIQDVYYH